MKRILISILLLLTVKTYSQDTIRLKHTNYTTVFSKSLKYPVLVEWWETKKKDSCKTHLQRKNTFAPDPLLYKETNLSVD